jgi:hypothetical protein
VSFLHPFSASPAPCCFSQVSSCRG